MRRLHLIEMMDQKLAVGHLLRNKEVIEVLNVPVIPPMEKITVPEITCSMLIR
jgi:hypothetical protein